MDAMNPSHPWPWTLVKVPEMPSWYYLVDASGAVVSDACIEGNADHMRSLAAGLRSGEDVYHSRCAMTFAGDRVLLWSPRNSRGGHAILSVDKAGELADLIERACTATTTRLKDKMSEDLLRKIASNWVHADSAQVREMASECVTHRMFLQRLERWAADLDRQGGDLLKEIADELRNLMKVGL